MKTLLALTLLAATGFTHLARADDHVPKVVPYPLQTCFISGDKLGEMGKPSRLEYQGQEIKFCCRDCRKEFEANPAAGMKKFEEAKKKAGK